MSSVSPKIKSAAWALGISTALASAWTCKKIDFASPQSCLHVRAIQPCGVNRLLDVRGSAGPRARRARESYALADVSDT